ncbi:methyl-accepting chemotaxis protein [Nitrosopumilus adriaticus]|uniref:Putative chemotaxis MCP methyltransferase CheR n=1 Tax=Nitrosopumilus adriaticus TaxID=1580092 RepID=A0A0D5C1A4_9ARCH|nr:methyl-accepting chemotaxis protein [Nitrosopumilus adriaticus]AJW70501.1 putative chemotaxis MCP methyltransferase CheR [Nitrosopumilus adriaticus]
MTSQSTEAIDKKLTRTEQTFNDSADDEKITSKVLRTFDEAVIASEQLSNTVMELESATKSQTSGIEEVSQSLQSIATAIQGVAVNANKAMNMMKESEKITQTISADAEKGMSKMDSMKSIVSESSKDVQKLTLELAKVDNMTAFITQIAEQTNLLALNAAIEAARAGDVGRGFAVVADEVRRLAENSKKGAEDISHLVTSLKDSSDKTTDSIQKGNSVVQDAYGVITNILVSIKNISISITEVVAQMQEISAATEQVSSGTEEATAASEEVLSVAQTNLSSFSDIAQAQDRETRILKDANTSANTLAEITDVIDSSTIISTTDIDGLSNYMNNFFLEITKMDKEELKGEMHKIFKLDWHDKKLLDNLWQTISSGKVFQGYIRNTVIDKSTYWLKTTISPIFDEEKKIKGYICIGTPITELMEMTGIEEACKDIETGKNPNPFFRGIIKKLKEGGF